MGVAYLVEESGEGGSGRSEATEAGMFVGGGEAQDNLAERRFGDGGGGTRREFGWGYGDIRGAPGAGSCGGRAGRSGAGGSMRRGRLPDLTQGQTALRRSAAGRRARWCPGRSRRLGMLRGSSRHHAVLNIR